MRHRAEILNRSRSTRVRQGVVFDLLSEAAERRFERLSGQAHGPDDKRAGVPLVRATMIRNEITAHFHIVVYKDQYVPASFLRTRVARGRSLIPAQSNQQSIRPTFDLLQLDRRNRIVVHDNYFVVGRSRILAAKAIEQLLQLSESIVCWNDDADFHQCRNVRLAPTSIHIVPRSERKW